MAVEQNAGPAGAEQQLTRVCSGDTNDNRLVIVISLPCYCIAFQKKKEQTTTTTSNPVANYKRLCLGRAQGKGTSLGSRESACSLYPEEEEEQEAARVMRLRNSCSDPELIGN